MKNKTGFSPEIKLLTFFFVLLLTASFSCRPKIIKISEPPPDRHQAFNFKGERGMVVAAHPLAAKAGLQMLKKGGNAVDAAIATAFALNAAEPFASGIGGAGFMVIYLSEQKKVTVINFREKAPSHAFPEMFRDNGKTRNEWRETHGLAVAVPGALAGWKYALEKYGTKNLAEVMQRGIEIAEKGFIISQTFSTINKDEYEKLIKNAGETSLYLNDGFPYEPGDSFCNPDLARTFRQLASKGIDEFYKGEIARKIVEAVKNKGGILTLEDLASYCPVEQTPLEGTYKGYTLYSLPPPSSGGLHIIQLLNIFENWPIKKWGHNSPAYIHHFSEALRFVFADRAQYMGDPEFVRIPINKLISKEYAAQIAAKIKPRSVIGFYPPGEFEKPQHDQGNTTHLCVVDKKGNTVSLTQSINYFFGSGIVPEGTGFLLNNHMADFSTNPHSPNAPRPKRRPVSSMAPLIMLKEGEPFLVLGSPGGTRIFSSLAQIIINVIDFGFSLDEAIEAPRFFTYSSQGKARNLSVESRLTATTIKSLEEKGHKITTRKAYDKYFGGAQGIMILRGRRLILGGADSRRDGYGAGY